MKIAILGNGGREHALALQISKSNKLSELYCIPGNAGTNLIAKNVDIELENFDKIYSFIKKEKIDLVVVGPEKPLVNGIVDYLNKRKIKVFGPNQKVSRLEGSKIFTKKICKKYKIPTAKFKICKTKNDAYKFLKNTKMPLVIKADGLAAGKGVYICKNIKNSKIAISEIFNGKFGKANEILLEEFLEGEEMSYFIISDGFTFKSFNTAQDHKRVGEGDTGKNTGGMGAYSPANLLTKELETKIKKKIIEPTLNALKKMGNPYSGFLYTGLMIKKNEPYLIEYNIRMGDPECQVLMMRLKTNLFDIIKSVISNNLKNQEILWEKKDCMTIVLCSKGYPGKYQKDKPIKNLNRIKLKKNNFIFHAGTKFKNNKIFTNGGRVFCATALGKDLKEAQQNAYNLLDKVHFEGAFYRTDIGYKGIK